MIWRAEGTIREIHIEGEQMHEQADIVPSVTFSPSGQAPAVDMDSATVRLWRVGKGGPPRTLPHHGTVSSVAFWPDGQTVAAGGTVAFAPDGQALASGSADKTVRLWQLR